MFLSFLQKVNTYMVAEKNRTCPNRHVQERLGGSPTAVFKGGWGSYQQLCTKEI